MSNAIPVVERYWRDFEISRQFTLRTDYNPNNIIRGPYTATIRSLVDHARSWYGRGDSAEDAQRDAARQADRAVEPYPSWTPHTDCNNVTERGQTVRRRA